MTPQELIDRFLIFMMFVIIAIVASSLLIYKTADAPQAQYQCGIEIPGIKGQFCQRYDEHGRMYFESKYYVVRVK